MSLLHKAVWRMLLLCNWYVCLLSAPFPVYSHHDATLEWRVGHQVIMESSRVVCSHPYLYSLWLTEMRTHPKCLQIFLACSTLWRSRDHWIFIYRLSDSTHYSLSVAYLRECSTRRRSLHMEIQESVKVFFSPTRTHLCLSLLAYNEVKLYVQRDFSFENNLPAMTDTSEIMWCFLS